MKLKGLNYYPLFLLVLILMIFTLSSYLMEGKSQAEVVLVTPYKYDADIASIAQGYSEDECCPWGFGHLGIDFLTTGSPKPFQTVCDGIIERIDKYDNPGNGYWQVNVSMLCNDSAYWIGYAFEIWSKDEADANNQMDNILSYIQEGQSVVKGQTIGDLYSLGAGAHVHFGFRKNGVDTCPEPYFGSSAKASILSILRDSTRPMFYPGARMCYGLQQIVAEAKITVDGAADEWSGIPPVSTDFKGDGQYLEGDDIRALYVATDADYLYLRMDLWENANPEFGNGASPHQGRYSFILQSDCWYPNLYLSVAGGFSAEGWSLGYNNSNGGETPDVLKDRPDLVGVKGSVIEIKIPFATVGRPSKIYRFSGEVVDCCVPNWYTTEETHCASELKIVGSTTVLYVTGTDGDCGGMAPCYSSMQQAISDAVNGSLLLISGATYTESIVLNQSKSLILQGGWDTSFENQNGTTIFVNAPEVTRGTLIFKEVKIKPE